MSFVSKAVRGLGNLLNGFIGDISGANYAQNKSNDAYQQALSLLLNSGGSPAAKQFAAEEQAALEPQFQQQDKSLAAKEAAMGITHSGAAKADFSDLGANQSHALAGVVAPLYESAIGQYGNIAGAMPGAGMNAYGNALNNFYGALETAATGMPSSRGSSPDGGVYSYQPSGQQAAPVYQTPYGYYTLAPNGEASNSNPYAGNDTGGNVA